MNRAVQAVRKFLPSHLGRDAGILLSNDFHTKPLPIAKAGRARPADGAGRCEFDTSARHVLPTGRGASFFKYKRYRPTNAPPAPQNERYRESASVCLDALQASSARRNIRNWWKRQHPDAALQQCRKRPSAVGEIRFSCGGNDERRRHSGKRWRHTNLKRIRLEHKQSLCKKALKSFASSNCCAVKSGGDLRDGRRFAGIGNGVIDCELDANVEVHVL